MDIREIIEKKIQAQGEVRGREILHATGFSRAYVNRILQQLIKEGRLRRVGKANRARYIEATPHTIQSKIAEELKFHRILRNQELEEHDVLNEIKRETAIFRDLPDNIVKVVDYAFTEMLNNAIEHSRSQKIIVRMERQESGISFTVNDRGIGIFRNIMESRGLANEIEAIQDLLKGKQTSAPDRHSGEGIFFTSKMADVLIIRGSNKKLMFDNRIGDIFVKDIQPVIGTRVDFSISKGATTDLELVFNRYAGEPYSFDKTYIAIEQFTAEGNYVSRSQARRVLSQLEKFRTVVLDFKNVELVGQAFADEVFRVWKNQHPDIAIEVKNANENVMMMIERAKRARQDQ
jgi:anti-sigma regulatory factor (Ser/Thr protein kinase)